MNGSSAVEESAHLIADHRYRIEHKHGAGPPENDSLDPTDGAGDEWGTPEGLRLRVRWWPTDVGARLDRLTVTGRIKGEMVAGFVDWTMRCEWLLNERPCKPPYVWAADPAFGGMFQCASAKDAYGNMGHAGVCVRYDFNPDKVSPKDAERILCWFEDLRITRVDVAVDYPEDLSLAAFARPECKRAEFRSADGALETVYLGAMGSRVRFLVYDKAKERECAGELGPDLPWWRVEALHRPGQGEEVLPVDLFDDVDATLPALNMGGQWRGVALLNFCREHPEYVQRLHWRARKEVRAGMAACFPDVDPHPAEVYRSARDGLAKRLYEYVGTGSFNVT